jgi:hypothetical protein
VIAREHLGSRVERVGARNRFSSAAVLELGRAAVMLYLLCSELCRPNVELGR